MNKNTKYTFSKINLIQTTVLIIVLTQTTVFDYHTYLDYYIVFSKISHLDFCI
jgi:hypothetical protein